MWILIEGSKPSKLNPKSIKHTFVGFEDGPKAVQFYDAKSRKIKISRNFVFGEPQDEPVEMEIVPRLPLEGETGDISNRQPPATPKKPQQPQAPEAKPSDVEDSPTKQTQSVPAEPQTPTPGIEYQAPGLNPIPLRQTTRMVKDHNYGKLGNPDRRLPPAPREQRNVPELPQDSDEDVQEAAHQVLDEISFMSEEGLPDHIPLIVTR